MIQIKVSINLYQKREFISLPIMLLCHYIQLLIIFLNIFWNDNHFPLPNEFDDILAELKSKNLLFNHSSKLINYLDEVTASEIKENWNINNDLAKSFGSLTINN